MAGPRPADRVHAGPADPQLAGAIVSYFVFSLVLPGLSSLLAEVK
jgi:hypothetical protein